jgi:predicted nucleotidyltransferase
MDRELADAVRGVSSAATELNLRYAMVGALVIEARLFRPSGDTAPRATLDADFAVTVQGWKEFEQLKAKLVDRGFQRSRVEHRLTSGAATVDLIPVGDEIAPTGKLVWPESRFEMNTLGFAQALAGASPVELDDGFVVPAVQIPALFLLKVLAFQDRYGRSEKGISDGRDLITCLRAYEDVDVSERRHFVPAPLADLDVQHKGAALLGMDVKGFVGEDLPLFERVERFVSESRDEYSALATAVASFKFAEAADRARAEARELMEAFARGWQTTTDSE